MADVELRRKPLIKQRVCCRRQSRRFHLLAEHQTVSFSVLGDDTREEIHELMPELQALQTGSGDDGSGGREDLRGFVGRQLVAIGERRGGEVGLLLFGFALVDFVAVGEEEVVGVSDAVLHAVFDHAGGTRWRAQLLDLERSIESAEAVGCG